MRDETSEENISEDEVLHEFCCNHLDKVIPKFSKKMNVGEKFMLHHMIGATLLILIRQSEKEGVGQQVVDYLKGWADSIYENVKNRVGEMTHEET